MTVSLVRCGGGFDDVPFIDADIFFMANSTADFGEYVCNVE
jgi:hypothetical protein